MAYYSPIKLHFSESIYGSGMAAFVAVKGPPGGRTRLMARAAIKAVNANIATITACLINRIFLIYRLQRGIRIPSCASV